MNNEKNFLSYMVFILVCLVVMICYSSGIITNISEKIEVNSTLAVNANYKSNNLIDDMEKNSGKIIETIKSFNGEKAVSYYITNEIDDKVVYLTFDDGPSVNTRKILDILKKYDIKATFFVVGKEDDESIELYKEIINNGHTIGNHSYSHDYKYIYTSLENYSEDFLRLQRLLKEKCNYDIEIARFPGGSNNTVSDRYHKDIMVDLSKYLIESNVTYFDWNVDSTDANATTMSVESIIREAIKGAKQFNSPIILMHDAPPKTTTVYALPCVIETLKKDGYEFRALSPDEYVIQFLRAKY